MSSTPRNRKEYIKQYVTNKRRKIKLDLIEYRGGKCVICGYDRCVWALDFHHIDPSTKEFGIGSEAYTKSKDKMRKEADKCVILCARCHREVEAGFTKLIIHE